MYITITHPKQEGVKLKGWTFHPLKKKKKKVKDWNISVQQL